VVWVLLHVFEEGSVDVVVGVGGLFFPEDLLPFLLLGHDRFFFNSFPKVLAPSRGRRRFRDRSNIPFILFLTFIVLPFSQM
jgi:hypothetical protein